MANVYSSSLINASFKPRFDSARTAINEYLDSQSSLAAGFTPNTTPTGLTHREIMEIAIFGDLSHTTPEKRAKYKFLTDMPQSEVMFQMLFVTILVNVTGAIRFVRVVNQELLLSLGYNSPAIPPVPVN